jgi:cell division septal protein FtsQ
MALLALVAVAIAFFSSSPAFFVYSDEAEYVGLNLLSPRTVWTGTRIPDGLSVFFLSPSQAADALRSLPEVKDASVSLRIPNRLRIIITERDPRVAWTQANVTWWVDETGRVLAMINPADVPATSPAVSSMDAAPLHAGMNVDQVAIRSILRYNVLAPEAGRFQYARDMGISVITSQGWPIHLGDDSDIAVKLSRMRALLADFAQRNVRPVYLDLRVADAPAYRR